MVGTFHAAGQSAAYSFAGRGLGRMARRLPHRCAVSPDAEALAKRFLGGEYELPHNGTEVERFATGPAHPPDGPTIFSLGGHEPRMGLQGGSDERVVATECVSTCSCRLSPVS